MMHFRCQLGDKPLRCHCFLFCCHRREILSVFAGKKPSFNTAGSLTQ